MYGFISAPGNPINAVTVASLAGLSYQVAVSCAPFFQTAALGI